MNKIKLIESNLYTGEIPLHTTNVRQGYIHQFIVERFELNDSNKIFAPEEGMLIPYEIEIDKVFKYISSQLHLKEKLFVSALEGPRVMYHQKGQGTLKLKDMNSVNIQNGPEFTLLYISCLAESDIESKDRLIIECTDNKALDKKWIHEIKNNEWFVFNSNLEYYFTPATNQRSIVKYRLGR